MKDILAFFIIATGIVFGVSILGVGIKTLFFSVNTAQKEVNLAYKAQDKTLDADNAIYNYEWFKQQYEDIEATKKQLDNSSIALDDFEKSAGDRKDWTFEDKNESSRLRAVKLGIQNSLETLIADYNARSKMANRNIFANSILPNYIDALTFITK